jgi:hypothetical protein
MRPDAPTDCPSLLGTGHRGIRCLVLHLHHEGEDIILWPLLMERGGARASVIVPAVRASAIDDRSSRTPREVIAGL